MTATLIVQRLIAVIDSLETAGRLDAFLFGSTLDQKATWSDVDVLLVCTSENDGPLARTALAELCEQFPIDLTIMTADEEAELDFIQSERCRWLTSIRVAMSETVRR
ncbi:nucleotidyltransferase domain-containing protein [Bradyrhizobium sp. GCM10023182]|uniref:Nucleotidyltransferase domain-containing protein n=1 Tax=Bradyrhizobium zhengyangense TaxID=2911009 RepID=A0ABS9LQR2_9BRAD|nr:nucleotidyltransferase domain-containing protein [Bradyrhizobium zhengyangense]MCG2669346.1 nucleotidyltransferase domain-containing protein [Bradyrhizobium zhengyangense]